MSADPGTEVDVGTALEEMKVSRECAEKEDKKVVAVQTSPPSQIMERMSKKKKMEERALKKKKQTWRRTREREMESQSNTKE